MSPSMGLSPQLKIVWKLVSEGVSNEGISETLVIGKKSVENYINSLYHHLGLEEGLGYDPRVKTALMFYYYCSSVEQKLLNGFPL